MADQQNLLFTNIDESQDNLEEDHKEEHVLDNEEDIEEDIEEDHVVNHDKDHMEDLEEEYKVFQSALDKLSDELKENTKTNGKYKVADEERRETWTGRLDFFISSVGYAVGIGNIWRFPYLCYKNGGGSFLIPYITFMILGALPMYLLEYSLGQFSSNGPISVWKICPLMKGIGYAMVIVSAIFCIYFNVMMGYVLYFLYHSLTSVLPWSTCNNEWNTEFCYIAQTTNTSTSNISSITGNNTGDLKMSSSEEFWSFNVLQITRGIEDMGNIRLELLLCLFIFWFIVFLCLCKGIKVSGKIVYVTAIFPYIVLIIFLARVVTLPGAMDGILFYVVPQWDKLLSTKVWGEAALQIFFSTGVGWGGLLTFASYNKFHDNLYRMMTIPTYFLLLLIITT
ncbi:sodium-dependent proline transporter-like [Mytilus edulis]|uniref:sodium-dependent proline transporter-like n=1 Tax=Mytilus edulis TaxID=6550 RepID=UPI0039EE09A6